MSLFLSKLLPLFVYPLGFACVMLLLALILVWKRPIATSICVGLALVALLVGGNSWMTTQLVKSLEWQYLPQAELPNAEAIVVLGGATRSQIAPRPGIDIMEAGDRPIYAAQLYRQQKAPLVILSGGRIAWRNGGSPESSDMAQLIEALGVPRSAILQDPTSLNTYENAVNVKKILDSRKIRRVLLVTSAMHMPRSMRIFRKQGIEAIPAPTDFLVSEQEAAPPTSTEAIVLSLLPDAEALQNFTRALKEYVGTIVYWLRGWL